jgi:acyl-CoA dehydrogenase
MYLCSATLKRYESEGRQQADAPLMHWAMWDAMFKAQTAFEGVISNFPNRMIGALMRRIVFPLGRPYFVPSDALGHEVAKLLLEPSATRDRLTSGMFAPTTGDHPVAHIERALRATLAAEPIEARIRAAAKDGKFDAKVPPGGGLDAVVARAHAAAVITAAEAAAVIAARDLTARVIRVDDFPQDLGLSDMDAPRADSAASSPSVMHKAAA